MNKHKTFGLISLAIVITLWVASALLINMIFTGEDEVKFYKPFFLTYYSTCFFTLFLILSLAQFLWKYWKTPKQRRLQSFISSSGNTFNNRQVEQQDIAIALLTAEESRNALKYTNKEMVKISGLFCILWFLSNYLYNFALGNTRVSSATTLTNTSPAFILMFSLMFRIYKSGYRWLRLLAVCLTIGGIFLIAKSDFDEGKDEGEESFLGDLSGLASAVTYAMFAVFLKIKVPEEREPYFEMSRFLGFVGLINMVCLLPLFPVLSALKIEEFELPNNTTLAFLTLNALFGTVISDYFWGKSVVLLGPLFTSLGLSLTIPIIMIIGVLSKDETYSWLYVLGTICILAGFTTNSVIDYKQEKKNDQEIPFSGISPAQT